jgi:hypothetical protein
VALLSEVGLANRASPKHKLPRKITKVSRPGRDRHGADGRGGEAVASELERAYAPTVLVVFVSYRTRRKWFS